MNQALFDSHLTWAESIADALRSRLPCVFDPEDLRQAALIQHWHCCEQYDPSKGVPYRGYAYQPIKGAVLMTCRRRKYRDATHEQIDRDHISLAAAPDEAISQAEEVQVLTLKQEGQRVMLSRALMRLSEQDRMLITQARLQGTAELDAGMPAQLNAAVKRLKMAVESVLGNSRIECPLN